jgi:hypothetical protein
VLTGRRSETAGYGVDVNARFMRTEGGMVVDHGVPVATEDFPRDRRMLAWLKTFLFGRLAV